MAGAAYEAMYLAALYSLPVIFFLENNFYAVSTHGRRADPRDAADLARADARHPGDRVRRHGPDRGAQGHAMALDIIASAAGR